MAGIVGSSNNPISGVTISTITLSALLLLAMLGSENIQGPGSTILVGSIVACAAAISSDNLQDLKAGYVLGATPIKVQAMQIIGVLASAFFFSPVLELLENAYGIGEPTEIHPHPLLAPQASLMAAVAKGVFVGNLPWIMIYVGIGLAVLFAVLDFIAVKAKLRFRTPVLAAAVGVYLPLGLSSTVFIGSLTKTIIDFYLTYRAKDNARFKITREAPDGLLYASGLITGESLCGILIAIPIVIGGPDILKVVSEPMIWPGVIVLCFLVITFCPVALGYFTKRNDEQK